MVMETSEPGLRPFHGLLHGHVEIDQVDEHFEFGLADGFAAGRAEHDSQFTVFQDDGGRVIQERRLAGANVVYVIRIW
jgi:hypothetical protein